MLRGMRWVDKAPKCVWESKGKSMWTEELVLGDTAIVCDRDNRRRCQSVAGDKEENKRSVS